MTIKSQNGWPVIQSESSLRLRMFHIPATTGAVFLRLQNGHAGFVLAHYALWFAEEVETVFGGGDDFGWSPRRIEGSDEWSNHASATAEDLNASKHPQGQHTFTAKMTDKVHARLALPIYSTVEGPALRWGGDYHGTVDEMHVEVNVSASALDKTYAACLATPRGRRLRVANP
jgi:hypothetical protein